MSANYLNRGFILLFCCALLSGSLFLWPMESTLASERGGREVKSTPVRERRGHQDNFLDYGNDELQFLQELHNHFVLLKI